MIKFIDLINESRRVILPEKTLQTLKNVVDVIFKRRKTSFKKKTNITSLPITLEDGTKGRVKIIVDPSIIHYGILDSEPEDSTDPKDFVIIINPLKVTSKKGLYQTLFHEIMHATDPNFSVIQNEKYWEDYDVDDDEKYYGHDVEFRAYTNEFFEALVNEFKLRRKRLKNLKSVDELKKSLKNIINHFSKNESLNQNSENILQSMYGDTQLEIGLRRTLDKMVDYYPNLKNIRTKDYNKIDYLDTLQLIRKYNPTSWNRFLSSLYQTYEEINQFL